MRDLELDDDTELDTAASNGEPKEWDASDLTRWYLGVSDDDPPPQHVVEEYCEDPPDEKGLVDSASLLETWRERTNGDHSNGDAPGDLPDATDNAYRARRQLGEAGLLQDTGEPAAPWDDPDRVIDVAQWNRRRPESVRPGGRLREVESDEVALMWRRAALHRESGLDYAERLTVCVLAELMKPCGSSCFPGMKTLTARADLAHNTVRKRLKSLRKKGWLNWLECRRASGTHSSRLYVPGVPEDSGIDLNGGGS